MKPKFKECMDSKSMAVLQPALSLPDQFSPIAVGEAGQACGGGQESAGGLDRAAGEGLPEGSLERGQGERAPTQGRERRPSRRPRAPHGPDEETRGEERTLGLSRGWREGLRTWKWRKQHRGAGLEGGAAERTGSFQQMLELHGFYIRGFPGGADDNELACHAGGPGLISRSGRLPWRRKWQPTPVFLPREFHGQRILGATVPRVARNQT